MGTEVRTFAGLKDLTEYLANVSAEYRMLYEDYSQWLGSLLRSCEKDHKDEEWYKTSTAALLKVSKGGPREKPQPKSKNKGGKKEASSCWVQSGNVSLSSSPQGQVEVLFEAIEKINAKLVETDKSKVALQQLERIGLGSSANYIVYFEDDIPKRIVLSAKSGQKGDETFRFSTEISVSAVPVNFGNE